MRQHSHNVAWTLSVPSGGHQQSHNIHTMFPEWCLDVGPQCWERHCHNIHTMLPECCLDVIPQCWGATLPQYSHNIAWTLSEHWPMLANVVAMLGFGSKYNVGTTFSQCCLNVHTTLLGHLKVSTFECCHNVGTNVKTVVAPTLWQYCHNIGALAGRCH